MDKKIIIIVVVAIIGILAFMAWGYGRTARTTQAQHNEQSSLKAPEALYDFGTISMANGNVDHMFEISNPTDIDVTIDSVSTSCMCTTAYIVSGDSKEGPFGMPGMGGMTSTKVVIPAHGTKSIDVVYDPNAHGPAGVGNIDRFASVTEAGGGTLQFEIKAVVTP